MRRTQHDGSFLVVEGKDDSRFWRPRSHDSCRLIDGCGKQNVVLGLQRLDEIEFGGVLGVVDSNHDHLAGVPLPSANLVATDAHDLECMLCRSPALGRVMAEYGDDEKIARFERQQRTDVRTALLNRGLVFGRLRWAVRRLMPNVGLGDLKPHRFIDERAWAVDDEELVRVVAESKAHGDAQALKRAITQLPAADPWHIVLGHDLIEILRVGLRYALGSLKASVGVDGIAALLRQAVEGQDLEATGLWRDIRRWEQLNRLFVLAH